MKKATYLKKLAIAQAKVTDATTVADLKKRKAAKRALERFWEKAAIAWMEENIWHKPYAEWLAGWQSAKFNFTLTPGGKVTVATFGHDFSWARGTTTEPMKEYVIPKAVLL